MWTDWRRGRVLTCVLASMGCADRSVAGGEGEGESGLLSGTDEATPEESDSADTSAESEPPGPCNPVMFEDSMLEFHVRIGLGLAEDEILDAAKIAALTSLGADAEITSLVGLECATGLIDLSLPFNQISDLSPIAELTALEYLNLINNQITTIPPLASAKTLRVVSLRGNPLTDLGGLLGATALEQIDLAGTKVADLGPLATSGKLQRLDATDTLVADLEFLADLAELDHLYLRHTQISDLAPLTELPKLEYLDISDNAISDLGPLASLPSLTHLSMSATGQSDLSLLSGLSIAWLEAADNGIVDVTPVTTFSPPQMLRLDLSNNAINELAPFATTTWLGSGDCFAELLLEGNPVAASPTLAQDHPYVCELEMFTMWGGEATQQCGLLPCP